MNRALLHILACPACPGDEALDLTAGGSDGEEVIEGALGCRRCGGSWPVRAGIPRFIAADQDYAGNFGFQWQHWRTVQIDRLNGHTISEDRLLSDTGWARDWFQDHSDDQADAVSHTSSERFETIRVQDHVSVDLKEKSGADPGSTFVERSVKGLYVSDHHDLTGQQSLTLYTVQCPLSVAFAGG